MRCRIGSKRGQAGFTLVELLAVIAIIGILAAIVVPNVARYIAKSRVTKAVAEIRGMETALTGALSDTGRAGFRDFLQGDTRDQLDCWSANIIQGALPAGCNAMASLDAVNAAMSFYETFFYELLRQGKNSTELQNYVLPEIRQKLGSSYMDIGNDPWGTRYHFWMGPLRGSILLRAYRVVDTGLDVDDPSFSVANAYVYNDGQRTEETTKMPGQPQQDEDYLDGGFAGSNSPFPSNYPGIHAFGFPASKDLPVYIWSSGPNLQNDANLLIQMGFGVDQSAPAFLGGGDDPNNWDRESGWENAPKV